MLDGGQRRGARAAVMPGDDHMISLGLGHPGGHRAHAAFSHQLDADGRAGIGVFQIVDELGQVFDGIDVVVRRRRDKAHARHRVAQHADVLGHLAAGQLPALAGLGTLRHLDLDLVGAGQVFGGDAEAAGSDLLDLGTQRIAFFQRNVADDALGTEHAAEGVAVLDAA